MIDFRIINDSNRAHLSDKWMDVQEFEQKGQVVDAGGRAIAANYQGPTYKIYSKQERELSQLERIGRVFLAKLIVGVSFGQVRHTNLVTGLLNKQRKSIYFGFVFTPAKKNNEQAIYLDNRESIETQEENIPSQNPTVFNENRGETLKNLIEQGDLLQLQSLMQSSGDFKVKDKEGNTPLINAVLAEKEDIIHFLIEKGTDLEDCDKNGFTSLFHAILSRKYRF